MNIIQCKICKKPFQSLGRNTCPDCLDKIDRDFITVRDYIYDHPRSRIDEVSKETEVEKAVILHLLKEGRLQLDNPDAAGGSLVCYLCKKPISTGRMCEDCKKKVASTMEKSIGGAKPPAQESKELKASKHTAKMHTAIKKR
jgi:predicted amidophosphoribosyltransferase